MKFRTIATPMAAVMLAVATAHTPVQAAPSPERAAEKRLAQDVKAIAREHKAALAVTLEGIEYDGNMILEQLAAGGFEEADISEALENTMALCMHEIARVNAAAVEAVTLAANLQAMSVESTPDGLLVGSCQELDDGMAALQRNVDKIWKKLMKRIKKLEEKIAEAGGPDVLVGGAAPPPPPVAPNPGQPAPAQPKKLEVDSRASSDTGNLCVGGTADGGFVMVTIEGPSGKITKSVPVDPDTCRYKACFGSFHGNPALARGNYAITSEHLEGEDITETTTSSHGVP